MDEKKNIDAELHNSTTSKGEKKIEIFRLRIMRRLLIILMVLSSFILIMMLVLILAFKSQDLSLTDRFFDKTIKNDIEKAIRSEAPLNVIKNIYSNKKFYYLNIKDILYKNVDNNKYPSETPLSSILVDMKTDYYLREKKDTIYLNSLTQIIDYQDIINPFDKLEQNQKNDFENLRFKLGGSYTIVASDVNRITDELHNKNMLVAEYLNKSNLSFLISIVALGLTIILSFYQIYQNRKVRVIALLNEILAKNNKKGKEINKD